MSPSNDGRLIILGGGIASLTTAFHASQPGHEQRFPGGIHVYEKSARLGGKGASGRQSTAAIANRIEEHGLHVWFGFYDNAFKLLADCHEYLEAEAVKGKKRWATSLRSVDDGFRACSRVGLMDYDGSSWLPWVADFPEDATVKPWHPRPDDSSLGSPTALAVRALRMVEALLFSLSGVSNGQPAAYATFLDSSLLPIPVELPRMAWLSKALDSYLSASTVQTGAMEVISRALALLTRVLNEARSRFDELLRQHDSLRRGWYMVDLLLAAVRGLVDDGVLLTGDYTLIDDTDLRAWLVLHGASEESVSSGFLKAIVYDLAFAYENGDPQKPSCSAATGVYGLLRVLLTYRGAIMWKMNAGMGEIVFAPLYEALVKRGVTVHFGHEATAVMLERRGARAGRIDFRIHDCREANERLPPVEVTTGVLAGDLPFWDERVAGEERKQALKLGPRDMVVYGLPVATIPQVMKNAPASWLTCAKQVKTVATVGLQVWLAEPVNRYAPWASPDITVGAYTEPFDTWSDMKTLAGERAIGHKPLRSVAYFANVAPPRLTQKDLHDAVEHFMDRGLSSLWPAYDSEMRLDSYERLNDEPSSRYTLSVPGSLKARLSPLDQTIANVRPVGDWTRNSISAGCIEAAVISGMLGARAVMPDTELKIFGEDAQHTAEKV